LSDHIYLVLQFISEGGSMITEGNPSGVGLVLLFITTGGTVATGSPALQAGDVYKG